MNIQLVEEGDTIVEGKTKIVVQRVERNACSKKGVHINDNACYDNTADVVVRKDTVEEVFEDEGPCPRCDGDHSWCQNVQPDEYGPIDDELMAIAYENSLKAWADRVVRV